MDKKIIEQLITCRALLLFLYNFRSEDIDELCKNENFKYTWDKLCKKRKNKTIVEYTEFYDAFSTNMSYKTQAIVLAKAMERYEDEARRAIAFSNSFPKHVEG